MKDLREFITKLDQAGELLRISHPVSPDLEITEITDRASKSPDKNMALLFENVTGYDMPVLINAFGSEARMNLALETNSLDSIAERIRTFLDLSVPDSLLGKAGKLGQLSQLANFPPRVISGKAPCQEVVITDTDQPMLDMLPILTCWPDDGGPFITMPVVFTKDAKTGTRNLGMYRLQKYNNTETGFHVHWHHDGAENTRVTTPDGKVPVAIALGCDPAVTYAATAPLPKAIDELIFAGFLRNKPVELAKCKTIDMEVPAHAEIILEGYVDLEDIRTEGPFGDHTGFYSLADQFPTFHLTAVTHRKDPIYQTTIVGRPPQEDCYLGKATERIFLPLLQVIIPEIVDMNLPFEGVFHNCAIVKIKKKYPGHAKKVMSAIWGSGQMSLTKYIIVLDEDVNIHDLSEVAWHAFGNTDPQRDMMFSEGPIDILDHASPLMGYGSKVGLDATRKWDSEGFKREWPEEIIMSEPVKEKIDEIWNELFN